VLIAYVFRSGDMNTTIFSRAKSGKLFGDCGPSEVADVNQMTLQYFVNYSLAKVGIDRLSWRICLSETWPSAEAWPWCAPVSEFCPERRLQQSPYGTAKSAPLLQVPVSCACTQRGGIRLQ
jgi:hypothetical protein